MNRQNIPQTEGPAAASQLERTDPTDPPIAINRNGEWTDETGEPISPDARPMLVIEEPVDGGEP